MTNTRCFLCKKKLKLVDQTLGLCRCGNTYCPKHRCVKVDSVSTNDDCHPCPWDYLKEQQTLIQDRNPLVQNSKLIFR